VLECGNRTRYSHAFGDRKPGRVALRQLATPMFRRSPERIAYRYYDLLNRRQFSDTERLFHPDALFDYPEFPQHLVGPAAHRALSQIWFTAFPDLRLEIQRMQLVEDHVVQLDSLARGTHTGPLRIGNVAVAATGRTVRVEFQHVLRVEDGKITNLTLRLDLQALVRRLTA
jgi:steroid delta-isomerase-like uncharacterized protein